MPSRVPSVIPNGEEDEQSSETEKASVKTPKVKSEPEPEPEIPKPIILATEKKKLKRPRTKSLFEKDVKPKEIRNIPLRLDLSAESDDLEDDSAPPILQKHDEAEWDLEKPKRSLSLSSESSRCPVLSPSHRLSIDSKKGNAVPTPTVPALGTNQDNFPPGFAEHGKVLVSLVGTLNELDVKNWNKEKVADFVATIPGCEDAAKVFLEQVSL